jgi:hypothetical protein
MLRAFAARASRQESRLPLPRLGQVGYMRTPRAPCFLNLAPNSRTQVSCQAYPSPHHHLMSVTALLSGQCTHTLPVMVVHYPCGARMVMSSFGFDESVLDCYDWREVAVRWLVRRQWWPWHSPCLALWTWYIISIALRAPAAALSHRSSLPHWLAVAALARFPHRSSPTPTSKWLWQPSHFSNSLPTPICKRS